MILIPNDVKCTFCTKIFCCPKCRQRHEGKVHEDDLTAKKKEDQLRNLCYLCNGEKFPIGVKMPLASDELAQHIVKLHLPLQCDKCSRIFENADDFKDVGKCCAPHVPQTPPITQEAKMDKENMDENSPPINDAKSHADIPDDILTPLTQINRRWRRKSKDFGRVDIPAADGKVARQTSTPMQENIFTKNHFTDSSSYSVSGIQISSINYTSSSSESDAYSPPFVVPKQQAQISPKRLPNSQLQNRSRPKMPVQATPLRQVMSKSIQRAIEQHGHYRQTPNLIHQRKMSFNSTNSSSGEHTSVLKVPGELEAAPLDLRMSPALRRFGRHSTLEESMIFYKSESGSAEMVSHKRHIEFEQIEVIIRRGEIKSETSALSNYKSCLSDIGRSGSLPQILVTPKLVGNNFLKKTISFETPSNVEKTPSFLMPTGDKQDDDDDEVFFTPFSTPVRRSVTRAVSNDVIIPIDNDDFDENQPIKEESKSRNNLWNFVSNVIKIASRSKGESISDSSDNSEKTWKFNFKKPGFVQKAADYFTKREDEINEQPFKRRRTSSTTETRSGSQSSPMMKRQKIQSRKPIERMRKPS